MEGDSVTLNTDTQIPKDDIRWTFGAENSIIAKFKIKKQNLSTYDVPDGRFRNRLKLDNQTGSLTIVNIRSEHAGDYKLLTTGINRTIKTFSVSVYECFPGVFGESVSVTEGDSVTLHTDAQMSMHDHIEWKFGANNSSIAIVKIKTQNLPAYDGPDGRFRDRLKLDNQTGSLTIINIRSEHAGDYEMRITGAKLISKTFSVSVYARLPVLVLIRDCSSFFSTSSQYNCSVLCSVVNVSAVSLSWYKGNSLLSSISVSDLSISLSLPLEVEYQDKNTYSCVINNTISNQTTHLDITQLCQEKSKPLINRVEQKYK
ncbi:uncharacterized protein LOC130216607 [Danio aesculapii]|uniref:uncharacterized protein LOC130216607 n=1 Tax=Danio aesculapii TaxID=1142201 RepID=UPI0024BF5C03|nr:uncharacterized protein LOC130216607 [Danio aesculapii]